MNIEKSRLISEAAPHLNASLGTINGNEFAAIVPVIPGHIGGRETNIVSAKALHKALGVGKDFSTWITDRISEYDFTIGHDYSVHKTISPNLGKSPNDAAYSKIKQSGRPGKDYLLSVGMAKELAMIERNESGINTADTSKVYHLLVVGADALTMSEITVDGVSVEKVSGCAREFLVVDHLFCSCSDSTKTFVHVRDVNEMSAMYCASGASNSEFSESIKKSLPLCGNTVYGYKAPHKTGAGFRSPEMYEATHDAPSVFFCAVSQTHTFFSDVVIIRVACKIMVGWTGQPKGWPVSLYAGTANSVQSTTSEFRSSGGGKNSQYKEAATCWLLPLPKNRNLSGLSPQFAAIARQLPPKFIILLPSLNAMLAVLWCAITSAFLLVVSAWRWHMIKTYDVHMDPLERTSQIITLTEVINDILVSNSPSRDERLKALLAILDLAVRDVHFLLEGGQMPVKTGATNE
ncbi:ash family protein [Escherichia coli]|nr:ash family protein [Escherichia coli]